MSTRSIHRKPRFVLNADAQGRPIVHGGSGGGYVRGCRCEECTEANRLRCLRRREERAELLRVNPGAATHGKHSTYVNWGCRCDPCTEDHRVYHQSEEAKEIARRSRERRKQRQEAS